MPNDVVEASGRADPRTIREKIADALIPNDYIMARSTYLRGDDSALLKFLAIPEYEESRFPWHAAATLIPEPPEGNRPPPFDLSQLCILPPTLWTVRPCGDGAVVIGAWMDPYSQVMRKKLFRFSSALVSESWNAEIKTARDREG